MKLIKLTLGYRGESYNGWQIQSGQPHVRTIQNEIQKALKVLTKEDISIMGSGRTDVGVNALGQVATFRTASTIPGEKFPMALNCILPDDIIIYKGEEVPMDFHPISDAVGKWYRYSIHQGKFPHIYYNKISTHVGKKLDIDLMASSATLFEGEHDFRSFCVAKTNKKSFVRRIQKCQITTKDQFINLDIYGEGFLHNMVRIIAGTLIDIGLGKLFPEDILKALKAQDRALAGPTAPAFGLSLMRIDYKVTNNYFSQPDNLDIGPLF